MLKDSNVTGVDDHPNCFHARSVFCLTQFNQDAECVGGLEAFHWLEFFSRLPNQSYFFDADLVFRIRSIVIFFFCERSAAERQR